MSDVKKAAGGAPRPIAAPVKQVVEAATLTKAAPQKAAAPTQWGPKGPAAGAIQAKASGSGFDTGRVAGRKPVLTPDQRALAEARTESPMPLTDDVGRRSVIAEASQYNPMSKVANNQGVICSAAATVNALILTSKDDATRAANADALKASADKLGAWSRLPPGIDRADVEKALTNFKAGSMRPIDAWALQQLAWAEVVTIDPKAASGGGAKPGVLGALVSQLAQDGAQFDGARFTETTQKTKNGVAGHWTVVANGTFANSGEREGVARGATLADSVDAPTWDADVRAPKGKAAVQMQIAEAGGVAAFSYLPMAVSTNSPEGLGRMLQNANGQLEWGTNRGPVPREK